MAKKNALKLKNQQKIITSLHILLDILSIGASFYLAFYLWDFLGPILSVDMYEKVEMKRFSLMYGVSMITLLIGCEVNDLYHPQRSMLNINEFQLIFKTWAIALGVTMVILYLAVDLYFSRGVFFLTWITILVMLLVERYTFFKFTSLLTSLGMIENRVLIYGNNGLAWELSNKLKQSPKLGYQIQGFIRDGSELASPLAKPVLGRFETLKEQIIKTEAERIFIAVTHLDSQRVIEILKICRETNCKFQVVPSIYDLALEQVTLKDLEGIPLLTINPLKFSLATRFKKRIMDLLVSLLLLVLLWPFTLIIAFFIMLSNQKPIFEKGTAFGKNQKIISTYLFKGVSKPLKPNKTFLNRFLALSGLNRYPQLWSVLKGEMSLVGPKLEAPQKLTSKEEIKHSKYNVKPGITGLWEITPPNELLKYPDKDMDLFYIQNQTTLLDMIILTKVLSMLAKQLLLSPFTKKP